MNYRISILLFVVSINFAFAQSVLDVYRFSTSPYLGSTRFISAGGAFTSLGNDFTATHQNPAGLAVFRRSEISLAMGAYNNSGRLNYQGSNITEKVNGFQFANIGMALKFDQKTDWQWSFGISFNKMADFNNRLTAISSDVPQSRIDMWIDKANGTAYDELFAKGLYHEDMAYYSYLIDPDSDNNYTTTAQGSAIDQIYTIQTSGGLNELAFVLASEKDSKLYLGGSLNIQFANYISDVYYEESGFTGDSITNFGLKEHNEISGSGFNLKVGGIYRFDNGFRLGAALHSPTWFDLEQSWEDEMLSELVNPNYVGEVISISSELYKWKMTAPFKAIFGVSKVFSKYGFLSVDYELNVFETANAKSDSVDISYLKPEIDYYLKLSHIFRVGAELRLDKFYLRGGYQIVTSGLDDVLSTSHTQMVSFGAGYRANNLTLEFSYAIRKVSSDYYFYDPDYAIKGQAEISQKPLTFSLAYRFGAGS